MAAEASVKTPRGMVGEAAPAPWAEATCLLAGALTPLVFHPLGTLGFEATKSTLVRLLAVVLVLGWLARQAPTWRWAGDRLSTGPRIARLSGPLRMTALAMAAYLCSYGTSTLFSIVPSVSLWGSYDRIQGLLTVLSWLCLGAAAAVAGQQAGRRQWISTVWLLASVPMCIYAVAQRFGLDPVDWLGQPLGVTSTLGSSTALSTYLAMLAPLAFTRAASRGLEIYGTRHGSRARQKPALRYAGWVLLLGLQIQVVLMTEVRAGLLAVVGGLGCAATAVAWRLSRRRWALAAVAAASAMVLVVVTLWLVSPVEERGVAEALDSSARQRLLIWQASLQTMSGSGWRAALGFGPETQALALESRFPAELASRLPDARFDRAHNMWLDQLLTTGVLGVVALVASLAALARVGFSLVNDADLEEALPAAGLIGGLVANVIANFYAFDSITTGVLFWLMAGLLIAPFMRAVHRQERPVAADRRSSQALMPIARLRVTAALAALAVGVAAVPPLLGPLVADLYHTRALALRAGEAPAQSLSQQLSAVSWAPRQDVYYLALAETYVELARTTSAVDSPVPAAFEDLYQLTPTGREALFEAARLSLGQAVQLNSLDPYSHLHMARLWTVWSEASREAAGGPRLSSSVEAYDRAIALSPNRFTFYDEAGVALTRLGRFDAAIQRYQQAERLDRPTAERLARVGDAEAARGDLSAARALYRQALDLDSRSAPAEHGLAMLDRASGDLPSALEHAQRAARFQMRNWSYHRDLALLYRDLDQSPQALAEARAARRLAPAWEWEDLGVLIDSVRG